VQDTRSPLERLYARARQRELRRIADELREVLRPHDPDLQPQAFEAVIARLAEARLAAREGVLLPSAHEESPHPA
jgi:hypothetical protein